MGSSSASSESTRGRGGAGPSTLDRLVSGTLRRLRSLPRRSLGETVAAQAIAYDRAAVLVRTFYLLGIVVLVLEMGRWVALREVDAIDPLWPAAWVDAASPQRSIDLIVGAFAVCTLLAAFLPRSRTARVLYSLTLLQYLSVNFGFGKINHAFHAWLFTSAAFILLPPARAWRSPTPALRRNVLQLVWSAQVILLFTYTLTGLWKLAYAVDALFSPKIGAFEPRGFSLLVAQDLAVTNRRTLLGEALVEHYWIGWLLFNGTIYLQTTSLLASLRPRLHRLWGGGLMMFHLGTQLAMGFTFLPNILLLGLLLVGSPWAPDRAAPTEVLTDLPGLRLITRTARRLGDRRLARRAGS